MLCKLGGTQKRPVTLHTDKDPPSAGLLLVQRQLCHVAEVLAAARAAVGFLVVVDELVPNQTGGHGERHATLRTLMRPHAAVNGLMLCQVGRFREALGTDGADVWTHSHVDFLVFGHATGQGECFPTVRTGERSFSQVLPLVALQGKGLVEGLPTVCAWEGLVVGVHVSLMLSQVRGAYEILSTGVTDVGLLTRVCADVFAIIRGPDVCFHTEGAVIWSLTRVQTFVLLQCALMRICFTTDVTHMWLESGVCLQVTLQVTEFLESPVAVCAFEGTLLSIYRSPSFQGK